MFNFCENISWATLPVAGGVYNQHPKLVEEWEIVFSIRAEVEHKRAERQRRESEASARRKR